MFTPIKVKPESKSCPNAQRKTRIINYAHINNAENLVCQNLSDIFYSYTNVPGTPTKVRVQVARDYIKPVSLHRTFNSVQDAPISIFTELIAL